MTLGQRVRRVGRKLRRLGRRLFGPGDTNFDRETFRTLARMRKWSPGDVIIDVGANDGRSIVRWRRFLGPTRVLAFEPVQDTFDTLSRATQGMADVRLFRCALGAEPGRLPIYLHDHSVMNSLRPSDGIQGKRQEIVEVVTLDAMMAQEGIEQAALLKIDAEGFDLEVLRGAHRTLTESRFDIIQVEAGFSAPGPPKASLADIQALLAGYGYYLYRITNQCGNRLNKLTGDEADGGPNPMVLVYCDALLVAGRPGQRTVEPPASP